MIELNNEKLTKLYSALKAFDHSNRLYFGDDTISNRYYLFIALHEDLVSHGIGALVNYFFDNFDSPGVDLNLRSILETLALIEYLNSKQITDFQYDLFRKHYWLVEEANRVRLMPYIKDLEEFDDDQRLKAELIHSIAQYLSLRDEDVEALYAKNDPLFVFTIDEKTMTYSRLIEKMLGVDFYHYYQFLSVNIHPHLFGDKIAKAQELRNVIIEGILRILDQYIASLGFYDIELDISKPNDEITGSTRLIVFERINSKNRIMQEILVEMSHLPAEHAMTIYEKELLGNLTSVIKDMDLCELLGYNEQTTIKYKVFVESAAVLMKFSNLKRDKESEMIQQAFCDSSLVQAQLIIDKINRNKTKIDEEMINNYYKFYQEKYKVDFETFRKQFLSNAFYAISKSQKNYKFLVRDTSDLIENNEIQRKIDNYLYLVSLDLGHAGGYLFNSSESVWTYSARHCLEYTSKYIHKLFKVKLLSVVERNPESNIGQLFLNLLIVMKKDLEKFNVLKTNIH